MQDGKATVRNMDDGDSGAVAALRAELWPDGSYEEHLSELPEWLADPGTCSFVAEAEGDLVGFLEGRLRSWVDGCATSPVGYLEGWFVAERFRRRGVGRVLYDAFEAWALEQGCAEVASDTGPDNAVSLAAHGRLGFEEIDRVVVMRKSLRSGDRAVAGDDRTRGADSSRP